MSAGLERGREIEPSPTIPLSRTGSPVSSMWPRPSAFEFMHPCLRFEHRARLTRTGQSLELAAVFWGLIPKRSVAATAPGIARPRRLGRPDDGLDPPGAGLRLLWFQADQPVPAAERVRRAGHRLDGEAPTSVDRERVAGEDHQVRIGLIDPERRLPAAGRQRDPRAAVATALEVGERMVEPGRADHPQIAESELRAGYGRRADRDAAVVQIGRAHV